MTSQFRKRTTGFAALALMLAAVSVPLSAQVPLLQHKASLIQWYARDFAVGNRPLAIAFDGNNIWVANQSDNTVTKLRAINGTTVATFAVGLAPSGAVFDGSNIWVVNFGDNTVTKLRASDGANLGTFAAGTRPLRIAFDGASVWITNNNASGTVTKLRASTGANLGTFAVGSFPEGVAYDGTHIWVANSGDKYHYQAGQEWQHAGDVPSGIEAGIRRL